MKKGYLLAALALLLVILGFSVFTDQGLLGLYRLRQEKARMEERLAQLETENARLRVEIERLKSDRAYLEKVAREELGLVNQDEMVFQFQSQPGKAAPLPGLRERAVHALHQAGEIVTRMLPGEVMVARIQEYALPAAGVRHDARAEFPAVGAADNQRPH